MALQNSLGSNSFSTATNLPNVTLSGLLGAALVTFANTHGVPLDMATATGVVAALTAALAYILPHK